MDRRLASLIVVALIVAALASTSSWWVPRLAGTPRLTPQPSTAMSPVPSPATGPFFATGEIVCLPHRPGGPQTEECAFGLRADSGTFYGLANLPQEEFISARLNTGARITVTGRLMAEPQSNYDIAGVIDVERYEVLGSATPSEA